MPEVTIFKGIDFLHGVELPADGTEHSATDNLQVREGAGAISWNIRLDMNDISGFSVSAWGDIEPAITNVTVDLQVSTTGAALGASTGWADHDSGAVEGIAPSEVVIDDTNGVSAGTASVTLNENAITANVPFSGTNRFRLKAVVNND